MAKLFAAKDYHELFKAKTEHLNMYFDTLNVFIHTLYITDYISDDFIANYTASQTK